MVPQPLIRSRYGNEYSSSASAGYNVKTYERWYVCYLHRCPNCLLSWMHSSLQYDYLMQNQMILDGKPSTSCASPERLSVSLMF